MTASPRATVLSNGRFTTVLSEAGGGYAAYNGYQLTRWAPDRLHDGQGVFLYLRDLQTGRVWSAGPRPVPSPGGEYEARFAPGDMVASHGVNGIRVDSEVCVAQLHDAELRRFAVHNEDDRPRQLELTSCLEVVLAAELADWSHPAFTKLFVETALGPTPGSLLATRRPRGPTDDPLWMVHCLFAHNEFAPEYETDRARFIGRGRTLAAPQALCGTTGLSGTVGNVLDPILSVRRRITIDPGATSHLLMVTGAGSTRSEVEDIARAYAANGGTVASDQFAAARESTHRLLADLHVPDEWQARLPELTGALVYGTPRTARVSNDNAESPAAAGGLEGLKHIHLDSLAGFGFKPHRRLVLLAIESLEAQEAAINLVRVAEYWRRSGVAIDLLAVADTAGAAADDFEREVEAVRSVEGSGSTVLRRLSDVPAAALAAARTAAHIVLDGLMGIDVAAPPSRGRGQSRALHPPGDDSSADDSSTGDPSATPAPEQLRFFNGYGGFSADGREYVIRLPFRDGTHRLPPLPWANVIANELTGCIVSERGAGTTWSLNSRENRLTPWFNDPVTDPHGEALYVRDDDTGDFWSAAFGPAPAPVTYEVRHGFGYTSWTHLFRELEQEVVHFVARNDPVRVVRLAVHNRSSRPRRLTFASYARWVLGTLPHDSGRFVRTSVEPALGAVLARNPAGAEFATRVAFSSLCAPRSDLAGMTTDRGEFLGAGTTSDPAWLHARAPGIAATDRGDPCAAIQIAIELAPHASAEVTCLLGQTASEADARVLIGRYGDAAPVAAALEEVKAYWHALLARVQVETPSPAIDLLLNGWATYQNLSCRMWGRSALYQSGGAFGYRDQLQDAAALLYYDPGIIRRQVLLHAGHQFHEGDVLHWWHPPTSKGIRTRFSDDLLWLPYVTAFYVASSGDGSVLDEMIPYLAARHLEPGDDEIFVFPREAAASGTLYEHCALALDRSLTRGAHGLPLIGTGDWNDGMNRVGREGSGESVWLGFFLSSILADFIPICEERDDNDRADRYRAYSRDLDAALNDAGWDGEWYRRAYYDHGAPIGSRTSDECRIDAIAQAWSVLSRVAPLDRAVSALDAMERDLVSEPEGLIRLLTPPFDSTPHDPGYIKGYLPGVRENGGQYTHAALWAIRALAELGRADTAARLLAMLSPCTRGGSEEAVETYRVEPYVMAADVYGVAPHVGRGGWTWYTGSAGWMLRVGLESVLGLTVRDGTHLVIRPCAPSGWQRYRITYVLPDDATRYEIAVSRSPAALTTARVDGVGLQLSDEGLTVAACVPIVRDAGTHLVEIEFGRGAGARYEPRWP